MLPPSPHLRIELSPIWSNLIFVLMCNPMVFIRQLHLTQACIGNPYDIAALLRLGRIRGVLRRSPAARNRTGVVDGLS